MLHRTSGNGAVPRQPFSAQSDRKKAEKDGAQDKQSPSSSQPDTGRMSERLAQMTEQTLEEGGTGAQKAIREAGFSEEVRQKLEARIQDTKFRSDNPAAFAQVNMPVSKQNLCSITRLHCLGMCRRRDTKHCWS